jgi:hypothetical protein
MCGYSLERWGRSPQTAILFFAALLTSCFRRPFDQTAASFQSSLRSKRDIDAIWTVDENAAVIRNHVTRLGKSLLSHAT